MRVDKVIMAVDDNRNYLDCWPIVSEFWKERIGITPILLHISDAESDFLPTKYGFIKKIRRHDRISTALQSQIVRLYGPSFFPDEVCMMSDVDMVPLKKSYFTDDVSQFDRDSFVVLAPPYAFKTYPMCYSAALGSTYAKILRLDCSYEEFTERLAMLNWGWTTDEKYLSKCIKESGFDKFEVVPHRPPRINKVGLSYDMKQIDRDGYLDFHMRMPIQSHPYIQEILDRYRRQLMGQKYSFGRP